MLLFLSAFLSQPLEDVLRTWARVSFEDRSRMGRASRNHEFGDLGAEGSNQG